MSIFYDTGMEERRRENISRNNLFLQQLFQIQTDSTNDDDINPEKNTSTVALSILARLDDDDDIDAIFNHEYGS